MGTGHILAIFSTQPNQTVFLAAIQDEFPLNIARHRLIFEVYELSNYLIFVYLTFCLCNC